MFAIYNNGTIDFKSRSENNHELKSILPSSATKLDVTDEEIKDFSQELKGNSETVKHINSYKKVANLDNLEPVYKVKDIMTKEVFHATTSATLEDLYYFIIEKKVSQIPITIFGKKIVGIVNKKLILSLIMNHKDDVTDILKRKIDDIYLPEVLTADPEADVRQVVKVMLDLRLDAIPIVDEHDTLLGIVSKTDILKAVANFPKLQLWS
ncbi:CBS domain-containing protein [Aliarcobacter trophiarum LMG 25534]|uniref:CBS domain-containing protein n=1 Tax=Aliarcobacter trophiarum LMG 25534 TaxID=1032241 RepID=A0AAD0QIY8_9BACT|nr:CBS domain-containing protein [Aliarcobacter trophiarum]AXK48551.1 CBS domain-containing protein [Aliarcobacter trophiarum LMG 25534]RXI27641.1 CBS domain-containing protein [Aliarcobacter trophiarum]RXJ89949.1 CBS domain-containing protein [Aliarcobacter trophiarum LMG 25534]